MKLSKSELKEFLDEKYLKYNQIDFIELDPVSIPHQFSKKEDIEIAGFLSATIAWGQRKTIINNANKLMWLMDNSPYDFVINSTKKDLVPFKTFVHRTFNGTDAIAFINSLKHIYKTGGMEKAFSINLKKQNIVIGEECISAIMNFRHVFFLIPFPSRTAKHISNPSENSAAKRLCMFLRWMIRDDNKGVDFGIWKKTNFNSSHLMCPLDVHSGNVARKLGLLTRTQNDWKAVVELTESLRKFDAKDPVKYDFALFGLGVDEKF